jgi:hypothetical protein
MTDEDFDHWITLLIGEREITVPHHDTNAPIVIDCSEEPNARGGTFSVGFPGRGIRFGSNLNEFSLYKTGIAAFLELVQRMELLKLGAVLDQLSSKVSNDVMVSKDVVSPLQSIVDNSQLSIQIYLANLGSTPFLVQRQGVLEIVDRNGGKYTEPCSLVLVQEGTDGNRERFEANSCHPIRV